MNPAGGWSGPDVAITALPGKDHSQHREHLGTLYPHFSVRARDWRYSLTSDGQEELYHYPSDPYEFVNLSGKSEYAETKAGLRAQLISLRDGNRWRDLDALPKVAIDAFELVAEVRGTLGARLGSQALIRVRTDDWTPLRIRVAGKRSQVWLNHRVVSDVLRPAPFKSGLLSLGDSEIRTLRLRQL